MGCLLPVYTGAGITCHPIAPSGFSGTDVVGVWARRYTTFGGGITPTVRLPEDVVPKYDRSRCSLLTGPTISTALRKGVAAE